MPDYGICVVTECWNPVKYKKAGLCGKHYARQRRHGTTDEPPKRGRTAEELAEYASRRSPTPITCGHPERGHYANGLCEPCYAKDRRKDDPGKGPREWKRRNPEKAAALERRTLLRKYGITPEDYEARWHAQGGRCANPECDMGFPLAVTNYREALQVDHCHRTGAVRGLLCPGCNRALGHADDDVARLEGLIDYLAARNAAITSST